MSLSTVRDVIESLRAEGWQGDPTTIWQLRKGAPGSAIYRLAQQARSGPPTRDSEARVLRALVNLMEHLGREEVDRVYMSVFGERPDEKNK